MNRKFIIIFFFVGAPVLLMAGVFFMAMFMIIFITASQQNGAVTGGANSPATWSGKPGEKEPLGEESVDLRQGGLKCIQLPGVRGTPAVDRRVHPWLLAAHRDVEREGLPTLSYTWLFRSNYEQSRVKSTYGPKAPVNGSMHEAGAAADVSGLGPGGRKDRMRIVQIFQAHKATWLGFAQRPDYPHFEWRFDVLGEPSKYQMIRRAQEAYDRGEIEGNCRGGNRSMQ